MVKTKQVKIAKLQKVGLTLIITTLSGLGHPVNITMLDSDYILGQARPSISNKPIVSYVS